MEVVILVGIIFIAGYLVWGMMVWESNNQAPVEKHQATVVKMCKRLHKHHTHGAHWTAFGYVTYLVTFELRSGEIIKFKVDGDLYRQLSEGEYGVLTYQGTRCLNFESN